MLGDGRVVMRHVDQFHSHHQRPDNSTEKQQTASTQLSQPIKKEETWQDTDEVVFSGDKSEKPAATEAAGFSEIDQRSETKTKKTVNLTSSILYDSNT